jgi:hypothetical protein
VRKKKSRPKKSVSEKTRADDERLRQELARADPATFTRLVKPLFRGGNAEKTKAT